MDARVGGRCTECSRDELDIRFVSVDDKQTRLTLMHGQFERYGAGAQHYRDTMASEYGWPFILDRDVRSFGAR